MLNTKLCTAKLTLDCCKTAYKTVAFTVHTFRKSYNCVPKTKTNEIFTWLFLFSYRRPMAKPMHPVTMDVTTTATTRRNQPKGVLSTATASARTQPFSPASPPALKSLIRSLSSLSGNSTFNLKINLSVLRLDISIISSTGIWLRYIDFEQH
jgi:hypothetical protein